MLGLAMLASAGLLVIFAYAMRDLLGPVAFVVLAIAVLNGVRGVAWIRTNGR
jgi:hypothetical protein